MGYVTVDVKFLFFNGVKRYTVLYQFGISKWYVFREEENSVALFSKEDKKVKFKDVNKDAAENILYEYLQQ